LNLRIWSQDIWVDSGQGIKG